MHPGQIPWESLTYAQLTSKIIECGLTIRNEIKILKLRDQLIKMEGSFNKIWKMV